MTTEDLEKKLKISNYTCIHCPTLELAKQVLNIFHQLGLRWCDQTHYTLDLNWDSFKEDTVYYPFDGEISSLISAHSMGYKIIKAKEFIALHTEEEKFDLENYIPKGELQGFPKEIITKMLDYQVEQGKPRDITVFEKRCDAGRSDKGFNWDDTKEKWDFWDKVISKKKFNHFFEKYPKQEYQELKNNKNMQENNKKEEDFQEFRIGDNVIDFISGQRGKILQMNDNAAFPTYVSFNEGESYTLDGRYYVYDKYPRLLHYRNDYDYSIIDFNNLPKRQEPKRWRAKKGEIYYSFTPNFEVEYFYDDDDIFDKKAYKLGNYFKTKEEAQEVADKLNKRLQELVNPTK